MKMITIPSKDYTELIDEILEYQSNEKNDVEKFNTTPAKIDFSKIIQISFNKRSKRS